MANTPSNRLVYKVLDGQDIDVEAYLPPLSGNIRGAGQPVIIDIHGGAFMLGASGMVNKDQVEDCLNRGWIVLVPNHRLCPQVNLLEGPMKDIRDLLAWIHDGGLQKELSILERGDYKVDLDYVFAFGTSSGGTLALSLGFDVPRPVAGIYDMYGPCNFADAFWTIPVAHVKAKLPPLTEDFISKIFDERPVPIVGGVSLEGQANPGGPNFNDPRVAFAMTQIGNGTVMDAIFPSKEWKKVDPLLNLSSTFPPTYIVHGQADTMVPLSLSKDLYAALQKAGVKCGMTEVPGEEHTFAGKMKIGTQTWDLQRKGFDFLESLIV
ncbi:Alpha/Beta hydrolase protein [Truncatella angustata]|uniref:Alpha/Beta hydrolase protein n=1 Tax=Truncatella angustata TaxID=152316 RepID=A0A9P8RJK7_9PEZI|nr:Alpha/Beta hydrolase protein [Truncatella angustata]KAH6638672.1 Alpha/Beta hydrolase protein [Truncatella angustata]